MVKWYFPSIVIDLFEFEGRENKYQNKCPSAWDFSLLNALLKCINEFIAAKIIKKYQKWLWSDQKVTKNELDFTPVEID